MSNLLNKRGDAMFLRLNVREAKMLYALANGEATGIDSRTLKRLQELGLVDPELRSHQIDPVTLYGLAWIKSNPTAFGR